MFNKNLKNVAVNELKKQVNNHNNKLKGIIIESEKLYKIRNQSIKHIEVVEIYVNSLANKPIEFERKLEKIRINKKNFKNKVEKLNAEIKRNEVKTRNQAVAGTAAGIGVAALGPSAAMAVATTFGTASTGTAIASLSGAAASNAALAWLGGGALSVSGAGMAGGQAILALAGPVGMAIGGVSIAGAGVIAAKKNKKIAEKAENEAQKIKIEISNLNKMNSSIVSMKNNTDKFLIKNKKMFSNIESSYPNDYLEFTREQKEVMGVLINNVYSMSKLIVKKASK